MAIAAGIVAVWTMVLLGQILSAAQAEAFRLQAAIQKEIVEGDLAGAIEIYEELARSSNRALAVKALLRAARCHEKAADGEAARVYERVVKEFSDQPSAAAEAGARLARLAPPERSLRTAWYSGDWQSGMPGLANWRFAEHEFRTVYDQFVVPDGGWTVAAVFSNNRMDFTGVTHAAWEIRSGVDGPGGGTIIAGAVSRATQTRIPGTGPFARDPLIGYRIEVGDLRVRLAPGRYWLSVAPVAGGQSFVSATRGRIAIGREADKEATAFFRVGNMFESVAKLNAGGQAGVSRHFSMGVRIQGGK